MVLQLQAFVVLAVVVLSTEVLEWCWDTTVGEKQEQQDLVADTIVLDRDVVSEQVQSNSIWS